MCSTIFTSGGYIYFFLIPPAIAPSLSSIGGGSRVRPQNSAAVDATPAPASPTPPPAMFPVIEEYSIFINLFTSVSPSILTKKTNG
ncbi:hypothetical protein U9M48_016053 [Paspalum notatum var. saurae]|uniref:Uncharacterized protein n=1 Tax=Paspalum notatum var. saurae TaxID=547442 RepID=A0AAQ3T7V2_PASNO